MQSVDDLARTIAELRLSEQEALLNRVAQRNFQKGLTDLAERFRAGFRVNPLACENSPEETIKRMRAFPQSLGLILRGYASRNEA